MAALSNAERSNSESDRVMKEEKIGEHNSSGLMHNDGPRNADGSSLKGGEDILGLQDLDPALNMKMHLVNNVSE